ncbi:MAG: hypothetical protein HY056_03930 [Proteobacteria bacterium]|nr:hypothetical protein [Pseudomonadota bacterium]
MGGGARGAGIDSEHLFGFTEGSDIGEKGEKELELEAFGRFGKRRGTYAAVSTTAQGKFTIFDDFRIAPGATVAYHAISGVPGLDNHHRAAFEGISFETKYRLLNRAKAPFGLTVTVFPAWARIDPTSGGPVDTYSVATAISADREIVHGRLFAAVNLTYDPVASRSRITDVWSRASMFGVSGAVATHVAGGVFVGGEVRYARAYEGLVLNRSAGDALFVGPTFYVPLSGDAWVAGVWNIQVAGHAMGFPGALDLVNFQRHEIAVRFGKPF